MRGAVHVPPGGVYCVRKRGNARRLCGSRHRGGAVAVDDALPDNAARVFPAPHVRHGLLYFLTVVLLGGWRAWGDVAPCVRHFDANLLAR